MAPPLEAAPTATPAAPSRSMLPRFSPLARSTSCLAVSKARFGCSRASPPAKALCTALSALLHVQQKSAAAARQTARMATLVMDLRLWELRARWKATVPLQQGLALPLLLPAAFPSCLVSACSSFHGFIRINAAQVTADCCCSCLPEESSTTGASTWRSIVLSFLPAFTTSNVSY